MNKALITQLTSRFEGITHTLADASIEFWYARELMSELGYDRWENFAKVINKARAACENSGNPQDDHFRDVTKMVQVGSSA